MTPILVPGTTCAVHVEPPRSGLLIDGCDYYAALYHAARQARRSLLIAGWQFESNVQLLRGRAARNAPYPVELLPFLKALCHERPDLEVHVLAWKHSSLFLLEREPLLALAFNRAHPRIHYFKDGVHPVASSHHQKMVIVDRAVAFLGGMDVCSSRWDDRCHLHGDDRRVNLVGTPYKPYHDVQAYVTGDAVDVLRGWFAQRWQRASGTAFALPQVERTSIDVRASVELRAQRVGLARTQPVMAEPRVAGIEELRALHVAAISAAERAIYIENQYYSSEAVQQALLRRLANPARPPLELIFVMPRCAKNMKERISVGIRQANLLRELTLAAAHGGHHLGMYWTADPSLDGDVPVYIHAKLLSVDDRFLLLSSANTTNRSMGLDTEIGVAWESDAPEPSIRAARLELLGDHTGLRAREAEAVLGELPGLVARLDALIDTGGGRLRRLDIEAATNAHLLEKLLPDSVSLDADHPIVEELLWEAAEHDDKGVLQRFFTAMRHLREALARPEASNGLIRDQDGEPGQP